MIKTTDGAALGRLGMQALYWGVPRVGHRKCSVGDLAIRDHVAACSKNIYDLMEH